MPLSQLVIFAIGVLVGAVLIAIGVGVGFQYGRRRGRRDAVAPLQGAELLSIIDALSKWTSEYSGSVSRYQDELTAAAMVMQNTIEESQFVNSPIVKVLDEIMQSNQSLKKRLDDAERQLDKQARDIEAYISEARTDPLTKLPNRRAFDQRLDEMFAAFRKGGPSFVVAMIDVDHFKNINDRYGHPEGDAVLKMMAQLLTDRIEGAYMVARFGGEEFVVLMPSPIRVAADRLDRFRKLVAEQFVPLTESNSTIKFTISIGLSQCQDDALIGPIVRRADEALYTAKGMGRNRVYFHDGGQTLLVGAPEVAASR
ncbi:MAG: GGDEF domain-containing protein [Pirellulaceae bacterium]